MWVRIFWISQFWFQQVNFYTYLSRCELPWLPFCCLYELTNFQLIHLNFFPLILLNIFTKTVILWDPWHQLPNIWQPLKKKCGEIFQHRWWTLIFVRDEGKRGGDTEMKGNKFKKNWKKTNGHIFLTNWTKAKLKHYSIWVGLISHFY